MFELRIETEFAAAHAIVMQGQREPVHGHNWHVEVTIAAVTLDADGLIMDFHALQHALEQIVEPFRNRDLNQISPFDTINPTAEHVAQHIGQSLQPTLPAGVTLAQVCVTEAPRCVACYKPTSG